MRNLRRKDRAVEYVGEDIWRQLDSIDRDIVAYLASNVEVSRSTLAHHIKKSNATISNHLRGLINLGVIVANGSVHDPGLTYSIFFKEQ